jgi:E3 ubiquitin-protein ligase MGRN1
MGARSSRERSPFDGAPSASVYQQQSTGASAYQVSGQQPGPSPANSNYARYPPSSPPHRARQGQQQQRAGQSQHRQEREQSTPAKSLTQTATIRNAVNLQKSTLRLVPSVDDPQFLRVAFEFDASEPCCAMTYVAVRERLDGPMKSALAHVASVYKEGTKPRPFQTGVKYSAGMKQTFPRGNEATSPHGIDLRLFREDAFLRLGAGAHENEFSLVVRLATVTDRGRREGHTLDNILPGEPMPKWVQGQTTFASVSRDPSSDTGWRVKVLKQKLWVEGVSYVLQEIYGLEKTKSGRTEGGECVICIDRAKNTTVLPCAY